MLEKCIAGYYLYIEVINAINNVFIWIRSDLFFFFVRILLADAILSPPFFLASGIFHEKLIRTRVVGICEPLAGLNPDPGNGNVISIVPFNFFRKLLFGDATENAEFLGTGLTSLLKIVPQIVPSG